MPPTSPQVPWIDDEGNFRPLADEEFALLDPRIGATQAYVNAFRMDYNRNLPTVAEKNNGVIDPEEVQNAQKYLQSDPHWYLREIITRTIARYRLIADGQIIFDINNNQAQIRAAFIAMMSLCTIKDSSIQPPTDAEITDKTLMLQWVAKLKANSNIGDVLCVSNHQDGRLDIVLNGVLDGKTFGFVWQVENSNVVNFVWQPCSDVALEDCVEAVDEDLIRRFTSMPKDTSIKPNLVESEGISYDDFSDAVDNKPSGLVRLKEAVFSLTMAKLVRSLDADANVTTPAPAVDDFLNDSNVLKDWFKQVVSSSLAVECFKENDNLCLELKGQNSVCANVIIDLRIHASDRWNNTFLIQWDNGRPKPNMPSNMVAGCVSGVCNPSWYERLYLIMPNNIRGKIDWVPGLLHAS